METKLTLKVIRAMHDLSQSDMANLLGITRGYYNQIEKGKRPMTPRVLLALMLKFGVGLDDLKL